MADNLKLIFEMWEKRFNNDHFGDRIYPFFFFFFLPASRLHHEYITVRERRTRRKE